VNWHLQDAKNQLSKVVRKAQTEGPQTVTVRGKPAAVIVSAEEYERLAGKEPSFVEHLLAMPKLDDDIWEEILKRPKDDMRDVDL
jgi:prevent-host-death family protein